MQVGIKMIFLSWIGIEITMWPYWAPHVTEPIVEKDFTNLVEKIDSN